MQLECENHSTGLKECQEAVHFLNNHAWWKIHVTDNPINIFNSINRRNLQRLTAYTKLNKMLAERGISIHQKTNAGSSTYHVRTVADLPEDVTYYRRKGKRASKRSRILAQAYAQLAIPGIE